MSSDPYAFKWDWPAWMKGSVPNPIELFAAPQNLTQPILPGWILGGVINVNERNSSSPDTEREIVAAHSYGHQLNRMMDVLTALIAELPSTKREAAPFRKFSELCQDIQRIKLQAATRRLDRIASDLATLKATSPDEYGRIAARLRVVLKEEFTSPASAGTKTP